MAAGPYSRSPRRITVGVMGGSYNPPHNGHIAVARAVIAAGLADRVMLVLSPQNPLKAADWAMAPDADRMEMLRLAVAGEPGLEASDIELSMPRPSYTAATLRRLVAEHSDCRFRLIIGGDNWAIFDRWRESGFIAANFSPIVYPRPGSVLTGEGADLLDGVPEFDVSSTEVRRRITAGEPVDGLLSPAVVNYITSHGLYTNNKKPYTP